MEQPIVRSSVGITLVGGGAARPEDLDESLAHAPCLVAADGGAGFVLSTGRVPEAVIGDMDSLRPEARERLPRERLHAITEQDSTDFDKALRSVRAPLVLGVGFLGRRIDHLLANFNVLVRRATQPCVLVGKREVVLAAPRRISLELAPGSRVSLFPMASCAGRSVGLHWPIDGLEMTPAGVIGTSNRVAQRHEGPVELSFEGSGMLLILPRKALSAVIDALSSGA
ncbi:thiamine diphosphokinase [Tropicimonas aquimaris]|uniref:Thiamine diphosphokinase n=1 Tax=Tropicimonas aquimaris TaxID=914152 RepID=A0ABW3IMN3_9RHOB